MRLPLSLSFALLAVTVPAAFCQNAPTPAVTYKTELNLPYRAENAPGLTPYMRERCRLDLYYPENKKGFNTVVWFHGGGLSGGEKGIPDGLKNQGVAVVAVNYRLSPKVKCRECIDDAAAAVAWTFRHIAEYGGNPDGIFVSGHSAGGYLTSMIGLDKHWLAAYGIDANKIAGLIPLSGHTITHFAIRGENGISGNTPVVDAFAPLFFVRGDASPILLITGDREKEMLGRYEENAYLMRMLKINGHKDVTLYEMQGYGHGMVEPAIPPLLEFIARVRPK
jgi:acetyl esterase/lipase